MLMDKHLDYVQGMIIMRINAISIPAYIIVMELLFLLNKYIKMKLLGHKIYMFNFLGISLSFPKWLHRFTHPPTVYQTP